MSDEVKKDPTKENIIIGLVAVTLIVGLACSILFGVPLYINWLHSNRVESDRYVQRVQTAQEIDRTTQLGEVAKKYPEYVLNYMKRSDKK